MLRPCTDCQIVQSRYGFICFNFPHCDRLISRCKPPRLLMQILCSVNETECGATGVLCYQFFGPCSLFIAPVKYLMIQYQETKAGMNAGNIKSTFALFSIHGKVMQSTFASVGEYLRILLRQPVYKSMLIQKCSRIAHRKCRLHCDISASFYFIYISVYFLK